VAVGVGVAVAAVVVLSVGVYEVCLFVWMSG